MAYQDMNKNPPADKYENPPKKALGGNDKKIPEGRGAGAGKDLHEVTEVPELNGL